ncbi:MAG TPA: protein kinase [Kofleriaceae bacterium]|nr:protein kinase [Kofleriaceae bacterium]
MPAAGEASRPTRLGRYELITRIGQGGMAEVQLALQRGPAGFEKLVVVKLVHNNLASQKAFVDMLLDEARVAALVKHPNVVDIYDLGQAEGRFFIAMEYLEGEPLLAVLRAGREGKRLDPLSTGRLIADTAEGLDAAHELRSMSGERLELVHHDISLGNIVVLYNGQVKLVDFGVAKATQNAAGSKAKVQGKFSYMAPEKLKGAPGDRRSDIFSLGCVMWEALTLKRLFRGGNDAETMKQVLELAIQPPSKVNGDVPPEYDAIVMRSLDRDPDKRHGTAKELAVEIEELLRKRGYGAKNDRVAKYMQETFKSHIDARKKLVQEVVSKGSASAEVLDAAFSDPVTLASGSPVTPGSQPGTDFSGKYRRVTPAAGVPVVTAAWADASAKTTISTPPVHPMFDGGKATELDGMPLGDGDDVTVKAKPAGDANTLVEKPISPIDRAKAFALAVWGDKTKRMIALGAGGVLLLILVIAIAAGGGDGPKAAAKQNDGKGSGSAAPIVDNGSDRVVADNTGSGSAEATGSAGSAAVVPENGSGAGSDDVIEMHEDGTGSGSATKPNDRGSNDRRNNDRTNDRHIDHHIDRPKVDVKETVNQATILHVRGDNKAALTLLQTAKAAQPGYAPTYRVLGNVYKKLGNNSGAKSAFQTYVKLAPKAGDVDTIKDEIKKL